MSFALCCDSLWYSLPSSKHACVPDPSKDVTDFHHIELIIHYFLSPHTIVAGSVITQQVCEHDNFHLACNQGQVISIHSALYGRQTSSVCSEGPIETHSCAATSSLDVVRQNCNGHQTCDIMASNDVFGDPCWGTFKYLDIQYKCESKQSYS